MIHEPPFVPLGASEEISALIAVLHETGQRLEELTGGEVDAVADPEGRSFLLRRAQEQLRDSDAARQKAILNALPASIALLDAQGVIVSVNEAWRRFGAANLLQSPGHGVGVNYLEICDRAGRDGASEARPVAQGIRSVLAGETSTFSFEYPCHSPTEQRWFLMEVTPLADDRRNGAVVMHLNISAQERATQGLRRFMGAMDATVDAIYLVDRTSMQFVYVNEAACRMQGSTHEELFALGPAGVLTANIEELARTYDALIAGRIPGEPLVMRRPRKDGSHVWVELRRHVQPSGQGWTIVTLVRDITAQREGEENLQRLRAAIEISGDGFLLVDRTTMRYIEVNQALCDLTGRTREELLGMTPMEVFNADRATLERDDDAVIADAHCSASLVDGEYRRKDGSVVPVETHRGAFHTDDGWLIVGTARDITARRAAERRIVYLNRVYAMLSGINALVVRVVDRDELLEKACLIAVEEGGFHNALICLVDPLGGAIVPVASRGLSEERVAEIRRFLASAEEAPRSMIARAIRDMAPVVSNVAQTDPQALRGGSRAASGVRSLAVLPLVIADESVGAMVLYSSEVEFFHAEEMALLTDLAGDIAFGMDHLAKKARLDYLAYYDELTGLANRSLFIERVTQYLGTAASGGHTLALFLIDLERFKNINDSLGRPAGDSLLKEVAEWLTSNLGGANFLARLGADHFAVVLPRVTGQGNLIGLLERWMEKFLAHPYHLGNSVFRISAKVGAALFPADGSDADTLFRSAEAALKKAKASGDRYLFHTSKMTDTVSVKLTLENQLREALEKEEFVLHYQPKVNLASGRITSAEALIRWN
ncbi:MAG: PAS domain S-box protein, partial [Casimicrobiaceae bacterium]